MSIVGAAARVGAAKARATAAIKNNDAGKGVNARVPRKPAAKANPAVLASKGVSSYESQTGKTPVNEAKKTKYIDTTPPVKLSKEEMEEAKKQQEIAHKIAGMKSAASEKKGNPYPCNLQVEKVDGDFVTFKIEPNLGHQLASIPTGMSAEKFTDQYRWLELNAHKYGFIEGGKTNEWVYVGEKKAFEIYMGRRDAQLSEMLKQKANEYIRDAVRGSK